MKRLIHAVTISLIALSATARAAPAPDIAARVERVLKATPIIDGHNDLPWELRDRFDSKLERIDLHGDTGALPRPADASPFWQPLMTDIPRLRAGHVGGQFWSVWIPTTITGPAAIQTTIEQIDLVKRMAAKWPADFEMAYTAADVVRIEKAGRIASLIGIEGGHQIGNSLPALRQMYVLGARYMTLRKCR